MITCNKCNKCKNCYTYSADNQTTIQLTFAEFLAKLGANFSIISNYREDDIKLYFNTHQQIYFYLQKLEEKKYIIDMDMERCKMIVNPKALTSTSEETQNLLDELRQYVFDTLLQK